MNIKSTTTWCECAPGDFVVCNDHLWQCVEVPADDTPPPDSDAFRDAKVPDEELAQFLAVNESLSTYEGRVDERQENIAELKSSAMTKLAAMGLTAEEVAVLTS